MAEIFSNKYPIFRFGELILLVYPISNILVLPLF